MEATATGATTRDLYDADTDELLGAATVAQAEASDRASEKNGGTGIILIDPDGDVVHPGSWEESCWTRRVYVGF